MVMYCSSRNFGEIDCENTHSLLNVFPDKLPSTELTTLVTFDGLSDNEKGGLDFVTGESLLAVISVPPIARSTVSEVSQGYVTADELVGPNFERSRSFLVISKSFVTPADLEYSNCDKCLIAVEIEDQPFALPDDVTPDAEVLIS